MLPPFYLQFCKFCRQALYLFLSKSYICRNRKCEIVPLNLCLIPVIMQGTPSAEASIQPAHVRTILAFARRLFPFFSSSTLPFPYVSDNGSMIQKSKEALFSPLCFLGRTISHFHFTVNNNS